MAEMTMAGGGRVWGRRVLAVLAGFFAVVVLSVVTDMVLEAIGVFPPPDKGLFDTGLLLVAVGYRSLFTAAGGFITARLAPDRPMRHAVVLGVIGIIMGSLGAISTAGQNLGPAWYAWALVVLALPCTWLGGWLNRR